MLRKWFKAHLGVALALGGVAATAAVALFVALLLVFMFMVTSSCQNNNDSGDTSISGGSGGAWTQPGTEAYKNAKATFDYWTGKGMSGAMAAGIIGNIGGAEDTGFVLNQREIGGGTGGGLYQFTPASKYLNDAKSDKSWSVVNQGDVILHLEPGTVSHYFKKNLNSSPEDCATDWMNLYERPSAAARASTNAARRSAALTAYRLFGGANISAKDSLLGVGTGTAVVGDNGDTDTFCSSMDAGVSGKWSWPFKDVPKSGPTGYEDGQQFGHTGYHRGRGNFHDGFDWGSARYHGDILAVHGGTVYKVGHDGARGYFVDVKSSDGYYEIYQEAFTSKSDIAVKEGDQIQTGQKIGTLTTSHLHLGISKKEIEQAQSSWDIDDGTWLDPISVIKKGLENG